MSRARIALAAVGALTALGAGWWVSVHVGRLANPPAAEIQANLLEPPRPLPPFELLDGHGDAFMAEDFKGAWSFLYFGYTYCPDVCPLALLELAGLKKALAELRTDVPVHYYFVSVDPARDTPERVGEYVKYFDPDFRGLTGQVGEIDKLAGAASVLYIIPDAEPGESYLVGHSSTITLIDPEGTIYAIFTAPHQADELAVDFANIIARHRRRD